MKVVCTICTDQIKEDFSAAPCGHTFHYKCLSQWLTHQKTCPQCREKCLPRSVIKLFINSNELSITDTQLTDPQEMHEKLLLQENLMIHKDKALEEARTSLSDIQTEMKAWQSQHKETHRRLKTEQATNGVLKKQLGSMQNELDETRELKHKMEQLKKRLSTLEGVERMLNGNREEMDALIQSHKTPTKLATLIVALKRDYEVLKEKKATLKKEKDTLSDEIAQLKKRLQHKDRELQFSKDQVTMLQSDLHSAEEETENLQKKVKLLQSAIESPGSRFALKRILESPMPDHSEKQVDLGASPLLIGTRPHHSDREESSLRPHKQIGTKRPSSSSNSKENVIMPVKKMIKRMETVQTKGISSHVLKGGLKFAPRKSNNSLKNNMMFSKKHHL